MTDVVVARGEWGLQSPEAFVAMRGSETVTTDEEGRVVVQVCGPSKILDFVRVEFRPSYRCVVLGVEDAAGDGGQAVIVAELDPIRVGPGAYADVTRAAWDEVVPASPLAFFPPEEFPLEHDPAACR